jgi:hypothetical protein
LYPIFGGTGGGSATWINDGGLSVLQIETSSHFINYKKNFLHET